jgi:hypothetical protein
MVKEMDESEFTELRRLIGRHEKLVFDAIKAGIVTELRHESQLYAQAVQEHMHLKPSVHVLDLLKTTKLDGLFDIHEDETSAIQSFSRSAGATA